MIKKLPLKVLQENDQISFLLLALVVASLEAL
jgi:hypothetical protein